MDGESVVRGLRRLGVWCVAALAVAAASARAAPVAYTMQVGGVSGNEFVVGGHNLKAFNVSVSARSCTGGSRPSEETDAWTITLGHPVRIRQGRFSFSGRAPPSDYPAGRGSADYTVTGTVAKTKGPGAAKRRVARGTISLSNGSDPYVRGCSGSYTFLAIPTPSQSKTVGGPGSTDFISRSLSFDYRHGEVRNLVVQAHFGCAEPHPSQDSAGVDAAAYGYRRLRVANGGFSLKTFVLDEYQDIFWIDLTGQVNRHTAYGRLTISEPSGLLGPHGVPCSGSYTWSASRSSSHGHGKISSAWPERSLPSIA